MHLRQSDVLRLGEIQTPMFTTWMRVNSQHSYRCECVKFIASFVVCAVSLYHIFFNQLNSGDNNGA